MSSESTIATILDASRFSNGCFLVSLVILCYDHLLTLDSEINYVWRRPKRLSFFLFILLRYVSLLSNIGMIFFRFGDVELERCHASKMAEMFLVVVQCTLVGSILGLRVYAMYNFNKLVLFCLIGTGFMTVVLASWSIMGRTGTPVPDVAGCEYPMSKSDAIQMAVPWESQLLCDVVVFGFTLIRSYRQPFKIPGSILDFMVRDGALYFAVLALVNLANILMYYLGSPWTASSLSWFTSTLSVTMISRLMLNLHKAADVGILTDDNTLTSVRFQSRHVVYREEESMI
ncbi:hypothetical protein C8R44DRAFT_852185 [Mycena epipterygia]|nr:hypothetical protein C8R44DRAFT_852185 [Mycena epipterygia]